MAKLSKEQNKSLARWVRKHHPHSAVRVEGDAEAELEELGFAVHGAECIEWGGYLNPQGYGRVGIPTDRGHYVPKLAHRAMREVMEGESSLPTLHSCGNEACINLDHTRYGTHAENLADQKRLGEMTQIGETHSRAKLTQSQVDEIKSRYVRGNGNTLGAEYGLPKGYVAAIVRGARWGS